MSFRFSFRPGVAAMTVGLGCALAGSLRAGEAPVTPGGVPTGTAPAPAAAKPTEDRLELSPGMTELKDRLPSKPATLETLFGARRQSVTPMQVIGPGVRGKDLVGQESDWAFRTPEDVINDYVMKEMLKMPQYGPDGRDLNKLSPVERYYERTHGPAGPPTGLDLLSVFGLQKAAAMQARETADSEAPVTLFEVRLSAITDLSSPNRDPSGARSDSALDLLNSAGKGNLAEALLERKTQEDQMEALKQIWGFQQPAPTPNLSQPGFPSGLSSIGGVEGLPGAVSVSVSEPFVPAPLWEYSPAQAPAAPLMPAAPKAPLLPGQIDPSAPPPSLTATKPAPPPVFSVPQRRF